MKLASVLSVLLLGLLGQDAPEDAPPPQPPEILRVLAVHATNMGRTETFLEPALFQLEEYLSELPYDTFREAVYEQVEAAYGEATSVVINDDYTLYCIPQEMTEGGEILFEAYIELKQPREPIEAIRVSGQATRGQGVVFRGLTMPAGELIVVLSIAKANESDGGGGRGQQEGEDPGSSGAEEEERGRGSGQDGDTPTDPDAELSLDEPSEPESGEEDEQQLAVERAGDTPVPADLANVEAILSALEEQDDKEQKRARDGAHGVTIQGDWW